MSGDIVIRAQALGKKYVIGHESERQRSSTLTEAIGPMVRKFLRKTSDMLGGRAIVAGDTTEEFWALKDANFEIERGEVVGIIGRNGAGKSTLLKILSRITEPTTGRVEIRGRVASLLEVGTGFHPELTGRENIYLNGAILGMSSAEIRRKFEEIVAFAEVEKFLDTPVKRYSSGMYVRLAFAVAAHLEPEILVVDEVLAVGDAAFQQKCLGKTKDFSKAGTTVLMVSHNMGFIREVCNRAILLHAGEVSRDGACSETVSAYLQADTATSGAKWLRTAAPSGEATITEISLSSVEGGDGTAFVIGDAVRVDMTIDFHRPIPHPQFGVLIYSIDGTSVLDLRTRHGGPDIPLASGINSMSMTVGELNLYPGEYYLSAWVEDLGSTSSNWIEDCLRFTILPRNGPFGDMCLNPDWGKYYVPSRWKWRLGNNGAEES